MDYAPEGGDIVEHAQQIWGIITHYIILYRAFLLILIVESNILFRHYAGGMFTGFGGLNPEEKSFVSAEKSYSAFSVFSFFLLYLPRIGFMRMFIFVN